MSLTETTNRNHEKLFPNHQSRLKATDPEFIECFDNFAFDEVLSQGGLDDRIRLMMILAVLIASQALGEYKVMLRGALNLGVTPVEAKETVYQAVPYCGIAVVFDFLHATHEITGTTRPTVSATTARGQGSIWKGANGSPSRCFLPCAVASPS